MTQPTIQPAADGYPERHDHPAFGTIVLTQTQGGGGVMFGSSVAHHMGRPPGQSPDQGEAIMTVLCNNCRRPINGSLADHKCLLSAPGFYFVDPCQGRCIHCDELVPTFAFLIHKCSEKSMPIVDIPPKIPTIKGEPAIKFGLKFLTVWTEQKEGFKVTQDLQPGFALPVLVLEKIPTPEQIEQVGRALDGKVTLGTGDSVTFKFGTPVPGQAGFSWAGSTPSPGAGLLQLGNSGGGRLELGSDPHGIVGPTIRVITQCGHDYVDKDDFERVVAKANYQISAYEERDRARFPIWNRAQEMSTKGKWCPAGGDYLEYALNRIEELEKRLARPDMEKEWRAMSFNSVGFSAPADIYRIDGKEYIDAKFVHEAASAVAAHVKGLDFQGEQLAVARCRIKELEKERAEGYLLLPGSRIHSYGVEITVAPNGEFLVALNTPATTAQQALAEAQEKIAAQDKALTTALADADHLRAQSIKFDAERQAALGRADNFKALLVEVLDDDWLDTKQAAHARHVARIKAMLGRS